MQRHVEVFGGRPIQSQHDVVFRAGLTVYAADRIVYAADRARSLAWAVTLRALQVEFEQARLEAEPITVEQARRQPWSPPCYVAALVPRYRPRVYRSRSSLCVVAMLVVLAGCATDEQPGVPSASASP